MIIGLIKSAILYLYNIYHTPDTGIMPITCSPNFASILVLTLLRLTHPDSEKAEHWCLALNARAARLYARLSHTYPTKWLMDNCFVDKTVDTNCCILTV